MSDILIRREGHVGRITLTRPQALNALTAGMVRAITERLDAWATDASVALVLIDAEGERAFCAGGDLQQMFATGRRGDFGFGRRFWADEYRMNVRIARYPKPVVVLGHGFVMGGGVGLLGHAPHRVLDLTAQVAMPECAIGFVPDIGGSLLLARAPGRLGEYLGLTGHRMGPGDAIHAGFADRLVPKAAWPALVAELVDSGDPDTVAVAAMPTPAAPLAAEQAAIDDAFSAPDLASLTARLEASDWGHGVLKTLQRQSPLSMACTLELVRAARREPGVEAALRREYRFAFRAASDGEMLEGIRAAVIDKDRQPRWRESSDEIRARDVAAMLATLGKNELKLPPAA